jgi:hypothetical protein
MRFPMKPLLAVALLAGIFTTGAPAQDAPKPAVFGAPAGKLPKVEKRFTRIFDGTNLDGWKMAGPGSLSIQPDGSILAEGGMGMLWYAKQQYKDFDLKLDWKAAAKSSNSGVFVRFPDPGNDPWVAVNKGYEIQISDDGDDLHRTGALYTFGPTSFQPTKPYGEWNSMEIKAVGTRYTVTINGKQVLDYVATRSLEGYVGVQNHDPSGQVAYRNIRIRKL